MTTIVFNTKTGQIGNKIPYISSLVTTAVPNTKIGKVKKKIRNDSKYITAPEFNKFTSEIFDAKLKQAKLAASTSLNTVLDLANKNKLKIEKLLILLI